MPRNKQLIIVRGGGDIATGTIYKLSRCGYPVLILETDHPSAIRRKVAFSEAVYDGKAQVEDMLCFYADNLAEAEKIMAKGHPALMTDPSCLVLDQVTPWALVDGILAKKNIGTHRKMADKTIALGPGFTAGEDTDLVIETMRGHNLGRIIIEGTAMPNTGVPGVIGGYAKERVVYAPAAGRLHILCDIGDKVEKGQTIAEIMLWDEAADQPPMGAVSAERGRLPVKAAISGLVRGMLREGFPVTKGFKMADIDPREEEYENCFRISDKARCIAGGVLEGLLYLEQLQGR